MTNKIELVSVPRELLECFAEKDLCNRTLGELMYWAREVIQRHDAAPAEDVRAVVQEPVGYRCRHSENEPWFFSDRPGYWEWEPIYRHPQRPVASEAETLFQKGQRLAKEGHGLSNLWGNCAKDSDMDEVQRGMEAYRKSQ
jgi:hypothetical protein